MRPRLVRWSAASLVLILAVMAESFTKVLGCERSVSESAATATTEPRRLPTASRVMRDLLRIDGPLVRFHGYAAGIDTPKRSIFGSSRAQRRQWSGSVGQSVR